MSGKLNRPPTPVKPPQRPAASGSLKPQQVAPRPASPPSNMPRPVAPPPKPLANPVAAQTQAARIQAQRQAVAQQQSTPRPVARPAAPPQRIMPQTPRPVAQGALRPPTPPQAAASGAIKAGARPGALPQPVKASIGAAVAGAVAAKAVSTLSINASAAHSEILAEVNSLQSSLQDLQRRSTFGDVQSEMTSVEGELNKVMGLLESARSKGYAFQKDLEEIAYGASDQWQGMRDRIVNTAQQQAVSFQNRLFPLQNQVVQLNNVLGNPAMARSSLSLTQSQVNTLLNEVQRIENDLQNSYAPVQNAIQQLNNRLTPVHWALGQLAEAKFKLQEGEDLVMAVAARWDQVGDDDPEGILYLSAKRLIFERKEKVATKKVLFVTVASQLVQEVLIDQAVSNVRGAKPANKGLFGHQDFVEVTFADAKLGVVPFHINGQESKQWAAWIESAMSGALQNDRAAGSGLSYADLTGPLTPADVMAAQAEVNALQEKTMLKAAREHLAAVENDVVSMGRTLAALRSRGYAIEKHLEADVTILAAQWDRIKFNTEKTIEQQSALLGEQMQAIQPLLAHLVGAMNNLSAARPQYMQLKSAMACAQGQAEAAEATVVAQYESYADQVEGLSAHLDWVGWMLDALETATFQLLSTESGIAAVEAVWARPGAEPENGILFLTDQRLLWEDRVGDFELKLNIPLAQAMQLNVQSREEGNCAILAQFAAGAPCAQAEFLPSVLVGDDWIKMFTRAKSGGYANDRAIPIDPAELERIRSAPQQCTNCAAAITTPVLRGQTEIHCEYCGAVMRI